MRPKFSGFQPLLIGPILFLLSLFGVSGNLQGQGLSTEGTEFWFGFMENWDVGPGNPIVLEIYISADDSTSGVLSMPKNNSFQPIAFNVVPGVTTRLTIANNLTALGTNQIEGKGIHLVADDVVSVYAMNKRQFSADVSVVLPLISLGNEYYVMSHWEPNNRNNGDNSDSEFLIVAIADNTEIEIIPSVMTEWGNPAGQPFSVVLNKGESYQVQARADLTGTKVSGVNNDGNCQNFALFAGNQYTKIGLCDIQNGHDHLFAQQYPINTWGTNYITVGFETRFGGDLVKILAAHDNTHVTVNNSVYTLQEKEFLSLTLEGVSNIASDKPISVGQFSRSQDCDGTIGDPFFLQISPNEQLLEKITFNAPTIATLQIYRLNIITRSEVVDQITLDGNSISNEFSSVPGNVDFSYAQVITSSGNHTITSQGGFIAYIYGFGSNESFGYATGASLDNLVVNIEIADPGGNAIPSDSICLHDQAVFTPVVNSEYDYYEWSFGDGTTLVTTDLQPVMHQYDQPGIYLFTLKAGSEESICEGGNQQSVIKLIKVVNPMPAILGPRSVCPHTTDVSYSVDTGNAYTYQWFVDGGLLSGNFGDSITVNWGETNPVAAIKLIATNQLGCVGDTVVFPVKINIQLEPEAPFGPDSLCITDALNVPYYTWFTQGSTYNWALDNGEIDQGQGNAEVRVNWLTDGPGKLWFEQTTVTDTICSGVSDTLVVFVQRLPNDQAYILSDKVVYQVGENVALDIQADSLFQSVNWDFDDGSNLDSVAIGPVNHAFDCPGTYTISINAYDSLLVCNTVGIGNLTVEVIAPEIEIIQVSTVEANDSLIQVLWKLRNVDYFSPEISLSRKGGVNNTFITLASMPSTSMEYIDSTALTKEFIYDYLMAEIPSCQTYARSPIHQSILLKVGGNKNEESVLAWNEYTNWQRGVDYYEIYRSIDGSPFELYAATTGLWAVFSYDSLGFDYCYRVKALERNGNKAFSWSNIGCTSFVPPIITYNVITPNHDDINDVFIFKGIEHYPNNILTIYNRWGRKILVIERYNNNWDGRVGGEFVSSGVYYYVLALNDGRAEVSSINGMVSVIR